MGTRGLLGLVSSGKRHASYNHWDSYPSGLGQKIAEFINALTPEEWDEMARLVQGVTWMAEDDEPSKELQELYSGLGYLGVNNVATESWSQLLGGLQGVPVLKAIKSGNQKHMTELIQFQKDRLFCEWSYFIDFENRRLESWDWNMLLDEISFDKLKEEGAEEYMERVQTMHDNQPGEGTLDYLM